MHADDGERDSLRAAGPQEVSPLRAVVVPILLVMIVALGCGDRSDAAREARRVFADASPPGGATCWPGTARRTTEAYEASCEFTLTTDWTEYRRWLRSRMERQYHMRNDTNEAMAFSRGLEGDLYTVDVALTDNTTFRSVRIRFRAAPW